MRLANRFRIVGQLHLARIRQRRRLPRQERVRRMLGSLPDDHLRIGPGVVAYHSMLVSRRARRLQLEPLQPCRRRFPPIRPQHLSDLFGIYRDLSKKKHARVLSRLDPGDGRFAQHVQPRAITIEQRALIERLFWAVSGKILRMMKELDFAPEELQGLKSTLVGHLLLQFLGVPIDARQLGDQAALSDHADSSPD